MSPGTTLAFAPNRQVSPEFWHQYGTAPPPLQTVTRVAERLGVSTATVYKLCARGELEHVRVGNNTIRISPAAVEAYLAARKGGRR